MNDSPTVKAAKEAAPEIASQLEKIKRKLGVNFDIAVDSNRSFPIISTSIPVTDKMKIEHPDTYKVKDGDKLHILSNGNEMLACYAGDPRNNKRLKIFSIEDIAKYLKIERTPKSPLDHATRGENIQRNR